MGFNSRCQAQSHQSARLLPNTVTTNLRDRISFTRSPGSHIASSGLVTPRLPRFSMCMSIIVVRASL